MSDRETQELLRQLGFDPSSAPLEPPKNAMALEEWAKGINPIRLRSPLVDPNDPRATESKGIENSGVISREFRKRIDAVPRPPAVTSTQRRVATEKRVSEPLTNPIERAAVAQGIPKSTFERPLTEFEVRLRTQSSVQVVNPTTTIPSDRKAAYDFVPLADPQTGKIIGYAKQGSDSLIVDVHGNIVQEADTSISPSEIQPDDLFLIAGIVKSGGKLAFRGGAALVRSAAARRVTGRALNRLRSVAAAFALGTTEAAPVLGGKLGARQATILMAEALEEGGSQVLRRGAQPLAGTIEQVRASALRNNARE